MGVPKSIKINDGYNGRKEYFYWSEYNSWEEARYYGKKIKDERGKEGMKVKYFIIESQDSWFLPVTKFVLYLDKRLRI